MTELFCPATLLVTVAGEAEFEAGSSPDIGGCLTVTGRAQAVALGRSLIARKVALIYTSPMARAVQTAEIAAAVLGCGVRVRSGLAELSDGSLAGAPADTPALREVRRRWQRGDLRVGAPGGDTGLAVVQRTSTVLEQVADEHRGETVLLVGHEGSLGLAMPRLATNLATDPWFPGRRLESTEIVELSADAAGLHVCSWAGRPVPV